MYVEDVMFCFKKRKLEWNIVLKGCGEKKNLNDWFNIMLWNVFVLYVICVWILKKIFVVKNFWECGRYKICFFLIN